jgi:hypothetical protein
MNSTPAEAKFEELLAEWNALPLERRRVPPDWTLKLDRLREEERCLRAAGLWMQGPEDMFGILGIGRAEIRHSAAIAWLLNPCGRHGFGTRMLMKILGQAYPRAEMLSHARVECEVTRGDCRADIVVEIDDYMLVIESKVDADESDGQCDTLFEQFSGAEFAFLTPDGRVPRTASGLAANAFRAISYTDVRGMLEQ